MASSTTLMTNSSAAIPSQLHTLLLLDPTLFSHQITDYFALQKRDIFSVSDPKDLFSAIGEIKPELIFIDYEIARGFDVKMLTNGPHLVIVIINADYSFEPEDVQFIDQADGFIVRETPSFSHLPLVLSRALKNKRVGQQLQELSGSHLALKEQYADEIRSKSEFIKKLSVNLQKPLDQLVQFAHIGLSRMQRKQFTQVSHYLAEVKMITEEMASYIQDLKEVALLKAGESRFHIEEIDMAEFLRAIKRQFQPIADSRDVQFHLQNQVEHPYAKGDFNKLSKVLSILLRNIFKNLPENGLVRLRAFAKKSFFEILIEDSSWVFQDTPGEQIFNVFNTQSFMDQKKMMGFSLSICKELMRGQSGDIRIEQDPDSKGARFVLSLPLAGNFFDEHTS